MRGIVLKKYISRLSELTDLRLLIVRYSVNFIVLIEILILPLVLRPEDFTSLEYLKNLLLFAPILLCGVNSGYINRVYKDKLDDRYALILAVTIIALLAFCILNLLLANILPAIAISLYIIVVGCEKICIADGFLVLASLYKAFYSTGLVLFAVFYATDSSDPINVIYAISVILGSIFWLFLFVVYFDKKNFSSLNLRSPELFERVGRSLQNIMLLVKRGILVSFQTFLLVGFFLFDRWFFLKNFEDNVNAYSLAFSLAQIGFIAINTVAFSMQRSLGESLHDLTKKSLFRLLKINVLSAIVLLTLALLAVSVLDYSKIFENYGQYLLSYIIISFLYGTFYVCSTYTVVAIYFERNLYLLGLMGGALMIDIIASFALVNYGYEILLLKSGLILSGVGFISLALVFGVVRSE